MLKKFLFTGIMLFICGNFLFAQVDTLWTKTYWKYESNSANSIKQTADNGYIILGNTYKSENNWDIWLIKTNSEGDTLWTKTYGGDQNEHGYSIELTNDNGYLILGDTKSYAELYNDVWLIKTNSEGDTLWTKTFNRHSDAGYSLLKTKDMGFIIYAKSQGAESGGFDTWLIKIDSEGDTLWTNAYQGEAIWDGKLIVQCDDEGYIFIGRKYIEGISKNIITRIDQNGQILWSDVYGSENPENPTSIIQDVDGIFLCLSAVWNTNYFRLKKFDLNGNNIWENEYEIGKTALGTSIIDLSDGVNGGYLCLGMVNTTTDSRWNAGLIRIGDQGDTLWSNIIKIGSSFEAHILEPTNDDGYLLSGYSRFYYDDQSILKIGIIKFDAEPKYNPINKVVINEIMQNPSAVNDYSGEWFELYNTSNYSVNLKDCIIKDNGFDYHRINSDLFIEPKAYVLLGNNSDFNTNGGINIDYEYSNITLGNGSDELLLLYQGNVIDDVSWDDGNTFPDPNGKSMYLLNPFSNNAMGVNWGESSIQIKNSTDYGTPGKTNLITTDQDTLICDTTAIGVISSENLRIYNHGNSNLLIDSIKIHTEDFSHSYESTINILPFDSVEINLNFNPKQYGIRTDTIEFISSSYGGMKFNIIITGFGYEATSHISTDLTELSYGSVMVGLEKTINLMIFNIGEDILVIDSVGCSDSVFIVPFLNTSIEVGDSLLCPIKFTPQDVKSYSANLYINSNDPDHAQINISLKGTGITPAPDIEISDQELNFSRIARNDTSEQIIIIKNVGLYTLEIEEIQFPSPNNSPFWIDFQDESLEYGDSILLNVYCSFKDIHSNSESVIMKIYNNDPNESIKNINISALTWRVISIPDDTLKIQDGIAIASEGDTIIIHQGRYIENLFISNKNIVIGSEYLYNNDDSIIANTIIDGGGETGGGTVINISEVDTSCIIYGLTITNGYEISHMGGPHGFAGGIDCIGASPKLNNLIIKDNYVDGNGGGIQLSGSSPIIEDCLIEGNSGLSGGGGILCTGASSPRITNSQIINNDGGSDGGGIYLTAGSSPSLNNVLIAKNIGDGILCWDYNVMPSINNCTIADNNGPGIKGKGFPKPSISNSIIWNNSGGAIIGDYDNTMFVVFSDIEGGWDGNGNINLDPLFYNPNSNNYFLQASSPCVGTGESGVNMGAFGICEVVNIEEIVTLPTFFNLAQNYPNPFNPTTTIQYGLPEASDVNLMIFDITGRKIKEWSIGNQQPGWHEIVWNGTNQSGQQVSTGVYIYSLRAGDFVDTKKMVFMK